MVAIERVIDEIASRSARPARGPQAQSLRRPTERNVTPYHQTVEDNVEPELVAELEADRRLSRAGARRSASFNADSRVIKQGIALTPVKFGISFTTTHSTRPARWCTSIRDGTIHLNHGGTEMGQGLYIKVAQVVAEEFQVDLDRVKITATTTDKVPNTSATAASSGADLNGMAAQAAARTIKARLIAVRRRALRACPRSRWSSCRAGVRVGNQEMPFARAGLAGRTSPAISLSATGFYATPKIHWDRSDRPRPAVLLFRLWRGGAARSRSTR